jgi:hypothetical protein
MIGTDSSGKLTWRSFQQKAIYLLDRKAVLEKVLAFTGLAPLSV